MFSFCPQITATNVGRLLVTGCSFSSLPRGGLVATGVSSLMVTGCVFSAIQVTTFMGIWNLNIFILELMTADG